MNPFDDSGRPQSLFEDVCDAFSGINEFGFESGPYEYSAETFGNGVVTFVRGDLSVSVTRDRSQYFITIGSRSAERTGCAFGLLRRSTGPERGDPMADDEVPLELPALAALFLSELPSLEPFLLPERIGRTISEAVSLGRRLEFERYGRPIPGE